MASSFSFLLVLALTGVVALTWVEAYDYSPISGYPGSMGYQQNPVVSNNRIRRYGNNYPMSSFRIPILSDIYDFFASIVSYFIGDYGSYQQPFYGTPYRH